mmetsp:Transcript_62859/g.192270  ORF Transcript_62859/g.192270 Transcript_62859/m.192270 type:complete len:296 (-) Transcript_62859:119-1006(-)
MPAALADGLEVPSPLEPGARPVGDGGSLRQALTGDAAEIAGSCGDAEVGGGVADTTVADVAAQASDAGQEERERSEEQAIAPWRWWFALVRVCYHVFSILCIVSMNVRPTGKLVLKLLLFPVVLYQTVRHWCSGTYFPMTKADHVYILRFGRKIDKNPPQISAFTIFSMVWMGIFFSVVTLVDFIGSCQAYCINDQHGLCSQAFDEFGFKEQWSIRLRFAFYLFYILSAVKRFVLTLAFTFSLTLIITGLSAVTCGYGCCILCVFLIRPFTRDSQFLCIPCEYVYMYVSFFYRRI